MAGFILSGLFALLPSMLLRIACYVLTSVGLYTMASSRRISKPWLAWIPVANLWLIGSLSDQYRYVARNQVKNKRKILLILGLVSMMITSVVSGMVSGTVRTLSVGFMNRFAPPVMIETVAQRGLILLFTILPLLALRIGQKVVEYMALFDIYESCDPDNSVLYLVFSILIGVTRPFFIFFNRNNEKGMPPRLTERECAPDPDWEE